MELTGMNSVSRARLSSLDETRIMAASNSADALLAVSMDRALAGFRENSGLGTFGAMRFSDWEMGDPSSPCLGLYLCACKNAYLSGSVEEKKAQTLLERLHDIVEALKECQDVFGTGIIFGATSASKNPEAIFDASEKGSHDAVGQTTNPWHTLGRLIDGLGGLASMECRFDEDLPTVEYIKNTSLDILNRLVDWVFFRASGWNEVTLGLVKGTECGCLSEALYHAYNVSEKETHLQAAELFDDIDLYDAVLSAGNAKEVREKTENPVAAVKFLGTLRRYISTNDKKFLDYATAFWEYKNVAKNIDPIELNDLKLLAQMLFETTGSASYANDLEELCNLSQNTVNDVLFNDPCEGALYSRSDMIAISRYLPLIYEDDYQKLELTRRSGSEPGYVITFKRTFTGTLCVRIPSGLDGEPEIIIDDEEYGFAVAGAKKKAKGFALVAGPFDVGCVVEISLPGLSGVEGSLSNTSLGSIYTSQAYAPADRYDSKAYEPADRYDSQTYASSDRYDENVNTAIGQYDVNADASSKQYDANPNAPVTEYSDLYKNEGYQSFFTAPDHAVAEAGSIESYGMLDGYSLEKQSDAAEMPQFDAPKYDIPKYDIPKYDTPQYDVPKYDAPQYGMPQSDTLKSDAPLYDAPQYGTSQYSVPDSGTSKAELQAPFELASDTGEVLYSELRKRFLIRLPEEYSSEEISVSVKTDYSNIELDNEICPTGKITLKVNEHRFTGHHLRIYTTDDYRDYIDYEIAIMRTGSAYEAGTDQSSTANAYREVTGSFAGELCYMIDRLRDEYEDGLLGSFNSKAFQPYGVDADTGYFWGITGSVSTRCYEFELEDGSYDLKLSLMAPEWCHDKPSIYLNPNMHNEKLLGENLDSESDNLSYRVNVRDGKLFIGVISDSNEVTIWRLEIRSLGTVAKENDYKPIWGSPKAPAAQPMFSKPAYTAPESMYTASEPAYTAPEPAYTAPEPMYTAPEPAYTAPEPAYTAPKSEYTAPSQPVQSFYYEPASDVSQPKNTYTAPEPTYTAPEPSYTAPEPTYTAPEPTYTAPAQPKQSIFCEAAEKPVEERTFAEKPAAERTFAEKPAAERASSEKPALEYDGPRMAYASKPNYIRITPTIAQGAKPQIRVAEPLIPKPKVTVMHSEPARENMNASNEASKIVIEKGSEKKLSTAAKVTGSIAGAVAIIGGLVSLFKDRD